MAVAFVALALTAVQAPSASPPQVTVQSGEVIVTARADPDEEIRNFVEALTPGSGNGQILRFETRAVCPAVAGVSPDFKQKIVARMRRVAAVAGAPVAKAKCRPNVVVMIVADKQALLQTLHTRYGLFFGNLSKSEERALDQVPGPAVAWRLSGVPLDDAGRELAVDRDTGTAVNYTTSPASRLTSSGRDQFTGAIVVIEAAALTGLATTQVADYATMRALAPTDPARLAQSQTPTILTVLDAAAGTEVPVTLTSWDLGLLRGLYSSPTNVRAASQRSQIRQTLKQDLQKEHRRPIRR